MEKQNVTLSLPKDILQQAKIIAIQKNTSLSNLLTETLIEIVNKSEKYTQAQERHFMVLKEGTDLGTDGQSSWSREDLHER
jgi:hypothetical protein